MIQKGWRGRQRLIGKIRMSTSGIAILGLLMLWNFIIVKDDLWENGFIYDPETARTYKCKMTMESPDILNVRGFIGISLLGRTNTWTRVK